MSKRNDSSLRSNWKLEISNGKWWKETDVAYLGGSLFPFLLFERFTSLRLQINNGKLQMVEGNNENYSGYTLFPVFMFG